MAKKSSTIHIENCFWDLIDSYKKENNMSSRNTAIECILSEYKALKENKQIIKDSSNMNFEKNETKKEIPEKNPIAAKLKQMEDDMQD